MLAVLVATDKPIEIIETKGDLKSLQQLVGGHIEVIPAPLLENVLIVVDEDGKLKNKKPNFMLGNDTIAGNAVFISKKGEEFASLNTQQILQIIDVFS